MEFGNKTFVPVILGSSVNAYGMARSLHESYGVCSLALGRARLRETAHSSIVEVRAYDKFDDPRFIARTLADLPREFPGRTILVISTVELYTNVLIKYKDKLPEEIVAAVCTPEQADRLMTKKDFYETCAELGIPHPRFEIVSPADLDKPQLGEDLSFPYPAILKPSETDLYPRLQFAGRKKVYLIKNPTELRQTMKMIYASGYSEDLIVQEFLAGNEEVMQSVNTYSDRTGTLKVATVGQIAVADQSPTAVGNNDAIITTTNAPMVEHIRHLLDSIGYTGTGNFDLMLDRRTGEYKVLEMNLRLSATGYYTTLAGANIPQCYVQDLVEQADIPAMITQDEKLWLNIPYLVARRFTPKKLRAQLVKAGKNGQAHTLWYKPDLNARRVADLVKIGAKEVLKTMKYHEKGINQ